MNTRLVVLLAIVVIVIIASYLAIDRFSATPRPIIMTVFWWGVPSMIAIGGWRWASVRVAVAYTIFSIGLWLSIAMIIFLT